jgi:hypothetical protein
VTAAPDITGRSSASGARGLFAALIAPAHLRTQVIWTASIGVVAVVLVGLIIRTTHFDLATVQFLNGLHHGAIGSLTNTVYTVFGPASAIVGTVVLTIIITALTRNLRVASTFAATIATTWLSLAVVKLIVHRLRPDPNLLHFPFHPAQIDASYPSGHAAFVTAPGGHDRDRSRRRAQALAGRNRWWTAHSWGRSSARHRRRALPERRSRFHRVGHRGRATRPNTVGLGRPSESRWVHIKTR